MFKNLKSWWKLKGKVIASRILLLILVLNPLLRNIPPLTKYTLSSDYYFALIATILLLFLQILLSFEAKDDISTNLSVLKSNDSIFLEKIKKAKKIDMAFSSTESIYLNLNDILSRQKIEIRLLLRNPETGDKLQKDKLERYKIQWKDIELINSEFKCDIKYCNNIDFRLIIIDDNEVYFGFYIHNGTKFIGNPVKVINVNRDTTGIGQYFIDIAKNKFEYYWSTGQENIKERNI
jgi:hypothetical protein